MIATNIPRRPNYESNFRRDHLSVNGVKRWYQSLIYNELKFREGVRLGLDAHLGSRVILVQFVKKFSEQAPRAYCFQGTNLSSN